jgi:hypothetical protein
MADTALNLTAKCRKDHETIYFMVYLDLFARIDIKNSKWEKNATDDTIQITLKKQMYGRWPLLFKNTDDDFKPGKALLWVEKHLEFEPQLDRFKKNMAEDGKEPPHDDFDQLVIGALNRKVEHKPPEFKMEPGPEITTIDVTDEVKAEDVTEEMRAKFDGGAFRDQLLNPSRYNGPSHFEVDEELKKIEENKRHKYKENWDDSVEWEDFDTLDDKDDGEIEMEEFEVLEEEQCDGGP